MEPKQSTALARPRTLPDSPVDGRPRFLAPLDCGGAVVVLLLAYVSTPTPDDLATLDLADLGHPEAHRVVYSTVSGHFRLATDGSGDWAVDLDGFRPRLSVSRGGFGGGLGGDATDAGRRVVSQSIARALREVAHLNPAALERARVADLRGDRRRALADALAQAVDPFGEAVES